MIGNEISDSSEDDSDMDDLKSILKKLMNRTETYVESEEVSEWSFPIATILTKCLVVRDIHAVTSSDSHMNG